MCLTTPPDQQDNPCYSPQTAYDQGYTDGRYFSGTRRPGALLYRDRNYDFGLAQGTLDRLELDQ